MSAFALTYPQDRKQPSGAIVTRIGKSFRGSPGQACATSRQTRPKNRVPPSRPPGFKPSPPELNVARTQLVVA